MWRNRPNGSRTPNQSRIHLRSQLGAAICFWKRRIVADPGTAGAHAPPRPEGFWHHGGLTVPAGEPNRAITGWRGHTSGHEVAFGIVRSYTHLVREVIRRSSQRMLLCAAMGLLSVATLGGCTSAWVTPTTVETTRAPVLTPTSPAYLHVLASQAENPTAVRAVLEPPPTPQLQNVTIEDVPVQSWTDPNDVAGLIWDGNYLWAATGGGVVRWDPVSENHRVYTVQDGLQSRAVIAIAQDGDGHIWVAYADRASWSEYDGETWQSHESPRTAVTSRYEAMLRAQRLSPRLWSTGAGSEWVWLSTAGGHIMSYDGSTWRSYGQSEGVAPDSSLVTVSDTGQVWAVGKGVSTMMEGNDKWERHPFSCAVPDGSDIAAIAVDTQGGLWLASVGPRLLDGSVTHLDPDSSSWTGHRHALNPAIPKQVYSVEVDAEGMVWICGDGGIASRHPGGSWQKVPVGNLIVQCFVRDSGGRFWMGTEHGIWSVASDGGEVSGPLLVPSPLLGNEVTQLVVDDRGKVWIGTPRGVSSIDRRGEARLLRREEALCLAVSPTGQIWVGGPNGLSVVESDGVSRQVLDQSVVAVAFDASNVPWVCTGEGDLMRLTGAGWQSMGNAWEMAGSVPRDIVVGNDGTAWLAMSSGLGVRSTSGEFALRVVEDGLPNVDVRALAHGPDDALWIATAHGLARRLPSGKWTRFTTASTEGGLRSTDIWDLFADEEGTLWIATSSGISVRTGEADWSYFDLADARSVYPEPGGAVWVGSLSGLCRIQQEALTAVP